MERRTRKRSANPVTPMERLCAAVSNKQKIIIFSGMTTFHQKGGIYARAKAKFHLDDGKSFFRYSFFDKHRLEGLSFYAEIFREASNAHLNEGHLSIGRIAENGSLVRHYTLNIDGLAARTGLNVWHPSNDPENHLLVELHGNVRYLLCSDCGQVRDIDQKLLKSMKACSPIPCSTCSDAHQESMRPKVMMYDDAEGFLITPNSVFDLMKRDILVADAILWVGISFEQSASCQYFNKVAAWLAEQGRLSSVAQAIVNPDDEAITNLETACQLFDACHIIAVESTCDEALARLADAIAVKREASS